MMRLADFITANIEPILAEWEAFARWIWPGAATDPATLRDHAEQMLHATVADMRAGQSDQQQSDKSKGKAGDGPAAARVNRVSAAHGVDRVSSGFDLAAVIAEYRALRASVIRLWRESRPSAHSDDLSDITRFNESIDQSLTEAVLAYTQHVARERAAALQEQEQRSRDLRELNDRLLVSSVRQHELTAQAERAAAALRVAKEEAESANRAKDTFLAVLSHELRTPLTPVVMTISALEIDRDMHFKFRDDLAMVRRNVDLEVKLIDDLLDLSRVTSGKLRLQTEPVCLHELLLHVVQSSAGETAGKSLHVRHDLRATNDLLSGDPARLQQVFWNLLRNAIKFTPDGGGIFVRTWNPDGDGRLVVEVEDSGVGIKPEILPRVFDAFEQGGARMTRQFGGLGLGLAIARAVVEMHGGSIRAASDGPGRGATFTVELATLRGGCVAGPQAAAVPAVGRQHPRSKVLLVEDHPDTSRAMAALLSRLGFEVRAAHSVALALELAAAERFDIVVSDIGLPDATGYELMEQIRDRHGIRGIALSGYGMEDDMRRSREAGFVEHVTKPVNVAHLRAVIERVLGK